MLVKKAMLLLPAGVVLPLPMLPSNPKMAPGLAVSPLKPNA